jgi:hypothetical protein
MAARTTYMNPDGTQGSGRYTDDYQFRSWELLAVLWVTHEQVSVHAVIQSRQPRRRCF